MAMDELTLAEIDDSKDESIDSMPKAIPFSALKCSIELKF